MKIMPWAPATPADAVSLATLFQQVEAVTPVGLEQRADEVMARLAALGPQLGPQTRVGRDGDGAVVAYGEVAEMGEVDGVLRIRLANVVHPDAPSDVRAESYDWLLGQAEQVRQARGTAQTAVLGTRCAENDHVVRDLLIRHGFELTRHERDLVLALSEPLPAEVLPPGLVVEPVDERYQELARLAHNEAYADSPSAIQPDQRTWPAHAIAHPRFLPDLSCLVLAEVDEGENPVAGFLFALADDDDENPNVVLHCLGSRVPWRRRGLATAMITRSLRRARSAGFAQVRLQVSDSNPRALALYGKLGFVGSGRGYLVLTRRLGPDDS
ncbi:GNAT family N-acetyltransferase [Micromonospora sp. NPDC048835]|uniref:GNAT family N-acetyltransferase n=1 Tax=Micromonospora sp. NPDC048835 TaxID=3155147 RepID=UPI0033FFA933